MLSFQLQSNWPTGISAEWITQPAAILDHHDHVPIESPYTTFSTWHVKHSLKPLAQVIRKSSSKEVKFIDQWSGSRFLNLVYQCFSTHWVAPLSTEHSGTSTSGEVTGNELTLVLWVGIGCLFRLSFRSKLILLKTFSKHFLVELTLLIIKLLENVF